MNALFRLDGKRALITGAGRGIGHAIAETFAEAGAQVTLCARTERDIAELANELNGKGLTARILVADVTDFAGFADKIAGSGPFDILVNNAGTNRPRPLSLVTEADYDAVLDLNLKAAIFATRAVTMGMVQAGIKGSVINMSSQMGHVGATNRTLYCASKWALEGFTKALASELGVHGIRVNTICPTFVETPLTRPFLEDEAFRSEVLSKIKLGRLGQPTEVAAAALYLASEAASLMTGSALMLDGGWTAD